jgi:hypothetical protein
MGVISEPLYHMLSNLATSYDTEAHGKLNLRTGFIKVEKNFKVLMVSGKVKNVPLELELLRKLYSLANRPYPCIDRIPLSLQLLALRI